MREERLVDTDQVWAACLLRAPVYHNKTLEDLPRGS
jgi:hypothetical protein